MTRFHRLLFPALIVGLTFSIAGCGSSSPSHAQLRAVHASPDAPNVDVAVDGKTVLTNVAYETSSAYLTVNAGSTKVEVRPTGTTTDVISATVPLTAKQNYTVLAIGFATAGKTPAIQPLLLTDQNTPPASGQIALRAVHASPSTGPVDIYVEAPGTGVGGNPTLTNVPFGTASNYLTVPAGSYEIYVTPTGSKTVALDSGAIALAAGAVRTAVALDAPGGGAPLTAIVLDDLN
jgi:hypothetical protein